MKNLLKQNTSGFTMIELIVTITILAVIAAFTIPSLMGFIDDAYIKDCRAKREDIKRRYVDEVVDLGVDFPMAYQNLNLVTNAVGRAGGTNGDETPIAIITGSDRGKKPTDTSKEFAGLCPRGGKYTIKFDKEGTGSDEKNYLVISCDYRDHGETKMPMEKEEPQPTPSTTVPTPSTPAPPEPTPLPKPEDPDAPAYSKEMGKNNQIFNMNNGKYSDEVINGNYGIGIIDKTVKFGQNSGSGRYEYILRELIFQNATPFEFGNGAVKMVFDLDYLEIGGSFNLEIGEKQGLIIKNQYSPLQQNRGSVLIFFPKNIEINAGKSDAKGINAGYYLVPVTDQGLDITKTDTQNWPNWRVKNEDIEKVKADHTENLWKK